MDRRWAANVYLRGRYRGPALRSMAAPGPVSYTHLDVYKRQGANNRPLIIFRQLILIDRSAVAENDREATLERDAVGSHLPQQSFVVPGLHSVNQGGGAGQRFGLGPSVCGGIL